MSSRNTAGFLGRLLSIPALFVLVACSNGGPAEPKSLCVQEGPAFRVQLSAADGPIPPDTKIRVSYQGGLEESFRVGKPSANEDVCCRVAGAAESPLPPTSCGSSGAGASLADRADAARATVVLCDVWSNGAATLNATAHGYEPVSAELMAQADEECQTIITSEVTLLLERGDAGVDEGSH